MDKQYLELQQYQEYASSTQRLNDALNRQLNTCYERIQKMMAELINCENINLDYLKEIQSLKNINEELKFQKQGILKTKTSDRILSLESIGDSGSANGSGSNSRITLNKRIRLENRGTQTKKQKSQRDIQRLVQDFQQRQMRFAQQVHIEIQRLQGEILSNKYELQASKCQMAQILHSNNFLQEQIKQWQSKCQQIQNLRMTNIHEMINEKQTLLYEINNKQQIILNLQEQLYVQSKELERKQDENNLQIREKQKQKIITLESINKKLLEERNNFQIVNQNLSRRVNSLEEHVNIIESENVSLKNAHRQLERKQNKSIQIRKTTLLETQMKMIKQQYTQAVKQNINLVDINSKLQKKRSQLSKQVQIARKERSEAIYKYNQLLIEYQHVMIDNRKKSQVVQDMNNKITIKENQAKNLKTQASQQIIDKLQRSLHSPMSIKVQKGLFQSGRLNNFKQPKDGEVPVRDVSGSHRLVKSKSTVVVYGIK